MRPIEFSRRKDLLKSVRSMYHENGCFFPNIKGKNRYPLFLKIFKKIMELSDLNNIVSTYSLMNKLY